MTRLIFSLVIFFLLIGCGGGSNSSSSKEIDFAKYLFPNKSMIKDFIDIELESNGIHGDGIETVKIAVEGNTIKYLNYYGTAILTYNIEDNTILPSTHPICGNIIKRYIQKGDTVFKKGSFTCKLENKIQSFIHKYIEYSGDIEYLTNARLSEEEKELYTGEILKIKCISQSEDLKDIYYLYFQKNIGYIASIDDNCYNKEKENIYDTDGCTPTEYSYQFYVNEKVKQAGQE